MSRHTVVALLASLAVTACSGGTFDPNAGLPDMAGAGDLAGGAPDQSVAPPDMAMGPPDFAGADLIGIDLTPPPPPPDMAMGPDMVSPYVPATVHQIDTDPGNGPFGNAKLVSLDRLVAVTDVDKYVNATNQQCRYQIWAQDPACNMPPCGMVIKAIGPMAPSPNSTGKDCPAARISGTLLSNVAKGDNFKVTGKVLFEVDGVAPMTVVEHQLFLDSFTPLQNAASITPLVISDTTVYSQFVTHMGMTWNKYEGMSVTLQPAKGTLQVSGLGNGGFQTIPGNVNWGNTFDGDYIPNGQVSFPTLGSVWKSISGVVSCRHGGFIEPTKNKDFVP